MTTFNKEKVEKAVTDLLEAMGEDVNREGLKETPRRVAAYWEELVEGIKYTNQEIAHTLNKSVKSVYNTCQRIKDKLKKYMMEIT